MTTNKKPTRSVKDISHLFLSCSGPQQCCPPPAIMPPSPPPSPKTETGLVIVDRTQVVCHINRLARQFLDLHTANPVGEVFEFFIVPGTEQNISIRRKNGQPGIGRMSLAQDPDSEGPLYAISILDITNQESPRRPATRLDS